MKRSSKEQEEPEEDTDGSEGYASLFDGGPADDDQDDDLEGLGEFLEKQKKQKGKGSKRPAASQKEKAPRKKPASKTRRAESQPQECCSERLKLVFACLLASKVQKLHATANRRRS